jgi:hypothetical protein
LRNYHPKRSGDILVLFDPHYFVNDMDGGILMASNHGGPWRYDTFVPVIFAGMNFKAKQIYREIEPNDIAPTLSAIMKVKPPSGSHSSPLKEVMQSF